MKIIFKYKITPVERMISLPVGAEVLHIHDQHGVICMWVLVDPDEKETTCRFFTVYGTGQALPEMYRRDYLGTVMYDNGNLVLHVFEEHE